VDRYDYDANGNMIVRNKGLFSQQTLTWDAENHLAAITGGGLPTKSYRYDADGRRIKKTSSGVSTYYISPLFEVTGSDVTRYYYFNGQRVAMYKAGTLTYLHSDHLGSTVLTMDTSLNPTGDQRYYAYGRQRNIGTVATDHQFTGQKVDSSGLYYYNARYYDPTLGTFLSPDTIVPDANSLLAYNRYMYAFGNPLKYNDPSGHCPWCGIGAVIDGAVTGATYMLTTDYSSWDGGQMATVIGAGALAGGLIGSGIGLAAGTTQMVAAMSMASSAAVTSGSGAIATAEAYMLANKFTGQQFDTSDFAVSTGTAAVEGAVNSLVPGSGLAAGATRAGISAAFGAGDYLGRNYANGTSGDVTSCCRSRRWLRCPGAITPMARVEMSLPPVHFALESYGVWVVLQEI